MKYRIRSLCTILVLLSAIGQAAAQGTAFTYQGQLNNNGTPANGTYDLSFGLFNAGTGGSPVVAPLTNSSVAVSNGQFTVILDFGSGVFNGANYWLELGVRTNGASSFQALSPRQAVLPEPYSMFAANAGVANLAVSANSVAAANITGTISFGHLPATLLTNNATGLSLFGAFTGSFNGDGSALTSLNASQLTAGTVADARLSANVALLNGTNRFTGTNNFAGPVIVTNSANQFSGTLVGSASTATNFSGSLSGDVTGTQGATVVSSVGGKSAANVAGATTAANAATSANTPGTFVQRDASGSFSAGTITARLVGNAATATSATTAGTAANFSGPLAGDVTGTQGATIVSSVGGKTAASVAVATTAANAATSANTPSTIVQRDASGNFSAAAITAASISGDGSALTNLNASRLAAGTMADARLSANVALLDGTNLFSGTNNFAGPVIVTNSANQFSGTLVGSASTATNFSGSLAGDVTGTQGATVVSSVGGKSAANVAGATTAANAATSANTPGTFVQRDASGSFSAGTITARLVGNAATATSATTAGTAANFSGPLAGDVTGTQGATVVSSVGGKTAASVASATTAANAATSANTPSTIVQRDASGNFSAAAITAASISGNGSALTSLNAAQLTAGTLTDARLSANVALLDGTNLFSGTNNFAGPVIVTNSANQFSGTFNGSVIGSASTATNFSGSLAGDVTGTQGATVVSSVGGKTSASVASATTAANAATSADTASTIVQRDASGNFSAGTIIASLSGNAATATTATSATTAGTAASFSDGSPAMSPEPRVPLSFPVSAAKPLPAWPAPPPRPMRPPAPTRRAPLSSAMPRATSPPPPSPPPASAAMAAP